MSDSLNVEEAPNTVAKLRMLLSVHKVQRKKTIAWTKIWFQATPRCLRRADSGMPHEELTPRSDSEASGASPPDHSEMGGSPPDNSETSSGVHSNSSRESTSAQRRSTSVDDLATDAANKVGWYFHASVWIIITPMPICLCLCTYT